MQFLYFLSLFLIATGIGVFIKAHFPEWQYKETATILETAFIFVVGYKLWMHLENRKE